MPGVNSGHAPARGWHVPDGGLRGVSQNAAVNGPVARRAVVELPGMAAVCGDGPVPRDARGARAYTLRVEAVSPEHASGIYAGWVATPPDAIDFSDAAALWRTTCMWRLIGDELNSNVPAVALPGMKPGLSLSASFNQATAEVPWATSHLRVGDELLVEATCGGGGELGGGEMRLSATLNGNPVVLPTLMVRCSFAMELWPYVAVCGRVTSVRLIV